jgi:hypothetical protein
MLSGYRLTVHFRDCFCVDIDFFMNKEQRIAAARKKVA